MLTFANKLANTRIASTDQSVPGPSAKAIPGEGWRVTCLDTHHGLDATQDKRVLPGIDFCRNRILGLLKIKDLPMILSLGFRAASALVSKY